MVDSIVMSLSPSTAVAVQAVMTVGTSCLEIGSSGAVCSKWLSSAMTGLQMKTLDKAGSRAALKELQEQPEAPASGQLQIQPATSGAGASASASQAALTAAQAAKLKHQLSYEQRRNLKKDAEAAEADLRKLQDNLERLQSQADEAAQASAALEQELSAEVETPFSRTGLVDVMPCSLCRAG